MHWIDRASVSLEDRSKDIQNSLSKWYGFREEKYGMHDEIPFTVRAEIMAQVSRRSECDAAITARD
jgi:hypothetical protein